MKIKPNNVIIFKEICKIFNKSTDVENNFKCYIIYLSTKCNCCKNENVCTLDVIEF